MLATTTHSDTGSLVWSPRRDKMAYVTSRGLQVYLSSPNADDEKYIALSAQLFKDLTWSDDGRYLAGRGEDDEWYVFAFEGMSARRVFCVQASTLDWFGDNQIVYVPKDGGLMLVDLRDTASEIRLT